MSTRRALLFSFMDRYAGLTISIASSMVIARLLTPGELGVYSVAMVLLGFLQTLRDFGAGQYLVQERELDSNRICAVWTIQLVTSSSRACIPCRQSSRQILRRHAYRRRHANRGAHLSRQSIWIT
ncbi:MAG: oligosaccharide flippase family protein [Ideonella sp.]|nr:oligosaccharide flippase family protein [Ideonella sp.]